MAAYLARFKGSGLRCYLAWCAEQGLDPLAARRRLTRQKWQSQPQAGVTVAGFAGCRSMFGL